MLISRVGELGLAGPGGWVDGEMATRPGQNNSSHLITLSPTPLPSPFGLGEHRYKRLRNIGYSLVAPHLRIPDLSQNIWNTFTYLKGRITEQEREVFHSLVYFSNACNSQDWARLKLGVQNSILKSLVGFQDSITWVIICCFPRIH